MSPDDLETYGLAHANRVILLADMVESVRLSEQDETGTVTRWLGLVQHIEQALLPAVGGRLVNKSVGDGVLLELGDVRSALGAAFAIHHACHRDNHGRAPDRHILLRVGIEAGSILQAGQEVFGHSVNMAARLSTLAGPGETVVSASVREQLTPMLDADVEDLGDCILKHLEHPVRAYRVGPAGPHPVLPATPISGDLRPTLAIVPFSTPDPTAGTRLVGEVLAEEIIRELSRSQDVNVISRLSTVPFRGRADVLAEARAHLNADYVLSGRYVLDGEALTVWAELAEAKSGHVAWTRRLQDQVSGVVWGEQEVVSQIASDIRSAILARELQRARAQPVPTLKNYTLLMAAVSLMHRLSFRDFEEARHLLQTLVDRNRRQPLPQAWLAKWYVLRVRQGWSPDPLQDAQQALQCTRQALDTDPECSLALAIDGLVYTHLLNRLDVAQDRYRKAIAANPNDSLAWLLKGTLHAFMDEGNEAVDNTQRAQLLSPLDPHQYFYDALSGTAQLAAKRYKEALKLAVRSLRSNRTHTSTLRLAVVASWRLGYHDEARQMAQRLMGLEPRLTISHYLERNPAAAFETGREWAEALKEAGVPV